MQFYETSSKPSVNIEQQRKNSNSQPVSVIANFNADGKIMPAFLSIEDYYGNVCKTKIDGVKYTKEGNGYTTYCCLISNNYRQQQINLTFYIHDHVWVLDNK